MPCEHGLEVEHTKLITEIDSRSKSNKHRLDSQDKKIEFLERVINEIKEMTIELKSMNQTLLDLKMDFDKQKSKANEKINDYISHGVKVIIAAIVGAIIYAIIDLIKKGV